MVNEIYLNINNYSLFFIKDKSQIQLDLAKSNFTKSKNSLYRINCQVPAKFHKTNVFQISLTLRILAFNLSQSNFPRRLGYYSGATFQNTCSVEPRKWMQILIIMHSSRDLATLASRMSILRPKITKTRQTSGWKKGN